MTRPEELLELREEDTWKEPYVSEAEKKRRRQVEEEERRRIEERNKKDSVVRALKQMMNDKLEDEKENKLEKELEREEWMDKPREKMTEEERSKMDEFQEKEEALKEEELKEEQLKVEDLRVGVAIPSTRLARSKDAVATGHSIVGLRCGRNELDGVGWNGDLSLTQGGSRCGITADRSSQEA